MNNETQQKKSFWNKLPGWGKGIIILFGIAITGNLLTRISGGDKNGKDSLTSKEIVKEEAKKESPADTLLRFKKNINENIISMKKEKGDSLKPNLFNLQIQSSIFLVMASTIKTAKSSSDIECKKLGNELETATRNAQIRTFPKIREKYVETIKGKLWEKNIYVDLYNNNVLIITSTAFANNANIAKAEKDLREILYTFRFKQLHCRWYKGQEDNTFYNLTTFADNVVTEKIDKEL